MNRRALWIACGLSLVASAAGAQNRDTEAVKRLLLDYKQNPTAVVSTVIGEQDQNLQRFVAACLPAEGTPACSRHDVLTMATLFLDAGTDIINRDYNRSGRFIRHGEFLLESLYRTFPDHSPLEIEFISLWYAHTARFLLTERFFRRAVSLVEGVTPWFVENAEIEVTRGLVAEIPFGWFNSNLRGRVPTVIDENARFTNGAQNVAIASFNDPFPYYRPFGSPTQGPYAVAVNQYLRALKLEPNHVRALLRLAWVRVRMRDDRAVQDAQRALQHAADDDERYLANLLLAAAADVKADSASAIKAYLAAREVGPQYQSACTGLAGAYTSIGDGANAARVSFECLALKADEQHPDPWLTLRFGLTEPALVNWLDAEARRP